MTNPEHVASMLRALGLKPVVDVPMNSVLSECPSCYLGATDPADIWRPLKALCDRSPMEFVCHGGCTRAAINRSLDELGRTAAAA